MTRERLKYIFAQIVDDDHYNVGLRAPWVENGSIYATDNYILLCLENKDGRDEAFTEIEGPRPSVGRVASLSDTVGQLQVVTVSDLIATGNRDVVLGGVCISVKSAKRAARVLRLFGLDKAVFSVRNHGINFIIYDKDGIAAILTCAKYLSEKKAVVHTEPLREDGAEYIPTDARIDDEKGEKAYAELLVADEEAKKANFVVYEVSFIKRATICVRAENSIKAKRLACQHISDWDFNYSDMEVDECEESTRDEARDVYSCYYDEDGECDWEE